MQMTKIDARVLRLFPPEMRDQNHVVFQDYVGDIGCFTILNDVKCPRASVGYLSNGTCYVNDVCSGFLCCLDMDFVVTQRQISAYIVMDVCNFEMTIGLGEWFLDVSLFTYSWGTEMTKTLGNAIQLK